MSDGKAPPVGLQIDGEILSGRLVVYADTLALELLKMADTYAELTPELLLYAKITPESVARNLAQQFAQAVMQYAPPPDEGEPNG